MARVSKSDPEYLSERERELRAELKRIRQQRREAQEAERQARLARVADLAEKFGLDKVGDTVLAVEFKRIAGEHPFAPESADGADTGKNETRTQPTEPAAEPTAAEPAAETAQAGERESRKRWFSGS